MVYSLSSTSLLPAASIISTSNSYGPAGNASVISNTFANPYHACCSLIKRKLFIFFPFNVTRTSFTTDSISDAFTRICIESPVFVQLSSLLLHQ